MYNPKKNEEEEEDSNPLLSQPTVKMVYKEMGLDQDVFRELEHQLIFKVRPPTLDSYKKYSNRITVKPKSLSSQLGPIFHDSKDVPMKYKDRRPERPTANKKLIGIYMLKKAKESEKKMGTNSVKWDLHQIDDDEDEEVEGEGEEEENVFDTKNKGDPKGKQGQAHLLSIEPKPEEKREYEDISSVEQATRTIQKYILQMKSRKIVKELRRRKKQRENLGMEILTTERSYVHNLQVCHRVYWMQLRKLADEQRYGFRSTDFTALFTTSFKSIKGVNETFLEYLERTVVVGQEFQHFSRISDCFLKITPFLKMYKDYTSNMANAQQHLKTLSSNHEFMQKLNVMDEDERTTKLGFGSYLMLPIQRVPRYRMLLQSLLKYTEKEHPDYDSLANALESVLDVANFLNDAIKKFEAREKVVEFHNELFVENRKDFSLIGSPHRRLMDEMELPSHCLEIIETNKNSGHYSQCGLKIIFFSDILCLAVINQKSSGGGKYKYEYVTHYKIDRFRIFTCKERPMQLKLVHSDSTTGAGSDIILKFPESSLKNDFLTSLKKVRKEMFQMDPLRPSSIENVTTEFELSSEGVAVSQNVQIPGHLPESDCVQLCKKTGQFNMWRLHGRGSIRVENREIWIDEQEISMVIVNPRTKTIELQVPLRGDNISQIVVGQKTKSFQRKVKEIPQFKQFAGLCFSLRYGAGNMSEGFWTGQTLDVICRNKMELLVWTRALKFILTDQGKTLPKRLQQHEDGDSTTDEFGYFLKDSKKGCDLLTWGRNVGKALGHMYLEKSDLALPKHVRSFLNLDVRDVQLGEDCTFVILHDGKVFSFGINSCGKLGHRNKSSNITTPTLIRKLMKKNIVQISCGKNHTLFREDSGSVYSCGSNEFGQLGNNLKKEVIKNEPVKIRKLRNVKYINAGQFHSSAVLVSGDCFMWGGNNSGQLGLGDKKDRFEPTKITSFLYLEDSEDSAEDSEVSEESTSEEEEEEEEEEETNNKNDKNKIKTNPKIQQTALGAWHSLFLDDKGNIFSVGDGSDGQLGNNKMGKGVIELTPRIINNIVVKGRVHSISSGSSHCGCVIKQGKVYMWGNGQFGQIGNGKKVNQPRPVVVKMSECFEDYKCKQLSCGQSHTLALVTGKLSSNSKIKKRLIAAWGSGTSGRLGIGKDKDMKEPKMIQMLEDLHVLKVNAGGCLSACVTSHISKLLLMKSKKELIRVCFACGTSKGKKKFCPSCSGSYCKSCLSKNKILSVDSLEQIIVCDVCFKIMIESQSK